MWVLKCVLGYNLTIIDVPSPNFSDRNMNISSIVLHYTGMETGPEALQRLTDPHPPTNVPVSSHYLVYEDGTLYRLVDDSKRAKHAGISYWRGKTDLNNASIGIEICNRGHEFGLRPFPEVQMNVVIALVNELVNKYQIRPENVIAHSDVAPTRKVDPGELFPWETLANLNLALKVPMTIVDPLWSDSDFFVKLNLLGYSIDDKDAALRAFQRRFRPMLIDGLVDSECRGILAGLLNML